MFMKSKNVSLDQETAARQHLARVYRGLIVLFTSWITIPAVFGYLLLLRVVYTVTSVDGGALGHINNFLIVLVMGVVSVLLFISVCWCLGGPLCAMRVQDNLRRIGFTSSDGEPPILISVKRDRKNRKVLTYEFETFISLDQWLDSLSILQPALGLTIADIREGRDHNHVLVVGVSGKYKLPKILPWKSDYLSDQESVLILGEDVAGQQVTLDINEVPHMLIGGGTGSGKSVLLVLAVMQMAAHGTLVYIVDYKGGLDYQGHWCDGCKVLINTEELHEVLTETLKELEERKVAFKNVKARNIKEYRQVTGDHLDRIVLACDEAMEIFCKSGLTGANKTQATEVENMLAVIARQGRALGIHLFLAMQRPDQTLNGQIRSNLQARYAGRCDNILAEIILGDTKAAKMIPPSEVGVFMDQDGHLFKGYYFNEK
jgi:S-DNA-T family DNA segregation ATPase FtsK/SpoIIIE